jgi:hypothetical protein
VFSIAVLALLIVVNLLLLFLLFRPDHVLTAKLTDQEPGAGGSPPATSSPATSSSTSVLGDQTASASSDASTNPPSAPTAEPVPVERLLLAMSSETAWRATVGNCDTPGEIERSTNGGATWERIVRTSPAPIVMLGLEPGGHVFAIGGTRRSCSVRYMAYAGDGTLAASTTTAVSKWFPSPDDRDEINGPGGTKATPCNHHAIGLAPFDLTRALVVCDNGEVMNTRDSGNTWRHAARIPNALAVGAGSGRYWIAGVRNDCDGVAVQALTEKNGTLTRGRTRCAPGLDVAGGQVAIDVTGGTIWLWSGSRIAISMDDGETWK